MPFLDTTVVLNRVSEVVISLAHQQDFALVEQADEDLSFTRGTPTEHTGLLGSQPVAVRRNFLESRHASVVEQSVHLLDIVGESAPAS
jgi:hypothetical protein